MLLVFELTVVDCWRNVWIVFVYKGGVNVILVFGMLISIVLSDIVICVTK